MDPYFYEIDLKWQSGNSSIVASHGLLDIQMVAPLIPGKEKNWTPNHMLGAAVSTCYMNTFMEVATNHNLLIKSYKSRCFMKLEASDGLFSTTEIMLCPQIVLNHPSLKQLALFCVEKAEGISDVKKALRYNIAIVPKIEF